VKITTVEMLPRRPRPKLGGEAKDRERVSTIVFT
jgi:hypothetical protein